MIEYRQKTNLSLHNFFCLVLTYSVMNASPKKRIWIDSKVHLVMTTWMLFKFILNPNFAIALKFRHAMQKASNSESVARRNPHGTQPIVTSSFKPPVQKSVLPTLQIYPQSWMMRKVGTYFSHDFECMKLVYIYSIEKYNFFVLKLVFNYFGF